MSLITSPKFNNSRRSYSSLGTAHLSKKRPEKKLRQISVKHSGRNFSGKLTTRHRGGQQKRYLRRIDWLRDKRDIPAKVISIEYDPNPRQLIRQRFTFLAGTSSRSDHLLCYCWPSGQSRLGKRRLRKSSLETP